MAEVQKLGREVGLTVTVERYDVVESAGPRDSSAVARGLDAFKARISLVQSGQHVEYTVRIIVEDQSWTMRKRFNEVAALHDVLKKRLASAPEMPSKSVMRQFSPEYLEARKVALTAYLQEISRRRDAMNCVEVQQFFELTERLNHFRQPHASEPVQAAEVHEAAFGITSFAYDPMQGLLLLGATDCSWTSRIDTKITNIKLPWEPAAPNLPTSQMSLWRQSPADLRFEMQFTCRYTPSITCVVISSSRDKGLCLCGLGDGTVGTHAIRGEPGVNSTGATLPLLRHTAGVVALAFDEVEQWVISASKDNAIMVYDTRRQMIQCEVQTPAPTTSMHYCQVQKRLFTGLQTGRTIVWDTSILPFQQVASVPDGSDTATLSRIASLDYDAVTNTIFTAAKEGFSLFAVKTSNVGAWGRKIGQITAVSTPPTTVAWASSSREILAGFSSGALVVFDVDRGEATYALQAHKDEITAILWLDAARRLITASKDKTLKIWDFPSLRRTPLEEQVAFVATAPTVSMAPHMAPPGGRARGSSFAATRGADPLLGRPAGGAPSPSSEPPRASFTASADPLARSPASPGASGSFVSSSYTAAAAAAATSSLGTARQLAGELFGAAAAAAPAPPPVPARPTVAGARSSAIKRNDSDDDLNGWDK